MHLVVLSTNLPRRCGLATFTADLRSAMAVSAPDWRVEVCAIDRDGLSYGPEVVEVIRQDDRGDYRRAAHAVAATGADLVVIQHEYGIFGGSQGRYVLDFADELSAIGMPYAVTLHTVLSSPEPEQAEVLTQLCRRARRVTVFTESAREIALKAGWGTPEQLVVVPHGVPTSLAEPVDPAEIGPVMAEALSDTAGRRVLTTFGLLRPGKGLETAIEAMPAIVRQHPEVVYLIAGATHPEVVRTSGEQYREELVALAQRLQVADHVRFVDTFLTDPELAALLQRTDLYLTPYRTSQQASSGALTFAMAAGCPVVSTSYPYARELVTPAGRPAAGTLVPFEDPDALAEAVCDLLGDSERFRTAQQAALTTAAALSWPAVAATFAEVFRTAAAPTRRLRAPHRTHPVKLRKLFGEIRVPRAAGGEPRWATSPRLPDHSSQPPSATGPASR